MKIIAMLLVAFGVIVLVLGGIGYKREKTVFDLGGVKATATEDHTIPLQPIVGVVAILGGMGLLVAQRRKAA